MICTEVAYERKRNYNKIHNSWCNSYDYLLNCSQSKSYEETKELCETLEKEMISLMSPDLQAMFEDYKEYTLNLKQTEQRDAYIDGLAFGIRTISEAFLHENKNRIW